MRRIRFHLRTVMAQHCDRKGKRVTYRELREHTGVSTNTISHMVNNRNQQVSLDVLERLCAFFGCELEDLIRLDPASTESERLLRDLEQAAAGIEDAAPVRIADRLTAIVTERRELDDLMRLEDVEPEPETPS